MRRRTWLVSLLNLSLAFAAPAFARSSEPSDVPTRSAPADIIGKPQLAPVEIRGTLDHGVGVAEPGWHYSTPTGYRITVDGGTYYLSFNDPALLRRAGVQQGQRVVVTGRLETRRLGVGRRGRPGEPVLQDARLFTEQWVHVTDLRPVQPEGVKESTVIEVRGRLDLHVVPGYPMREEVAVVEVGDQSFVLNFGDHKALREQAERLNGKLVTIRGTRGKDRKFTVMCQPPLTLPSLDITSLEGPGVKLTVVELHGELVLHRDWQWRFLANGVDYRLDSGTAEVLRRMPRGFKDPHAIVRGILVEGGATADGPVVLVASLHFDPDYVSVRWLEEKAL
jgi:hypothetical protein